VTVVEKPGVGVAANEYGFFSLSLPKGKYTLRFSYAGRKLELVPVTLDSNITLSIQLTEEAVMQEVVVASKKRNDVLTKASIGVEVLDMKTAAKIPVVFGEKDLAKTIQLLPGVKSNGEGTNGFSVRGALPTKTLSY
jgi:CarboxypepD_reg-like domain